MEELKTIELFIGANNITKRTERGLIEKTVAERHNGFTLIPAIGYWMGDREESCSVVICDRPSIIFETVKILKKVLKQDAIGYREVAPLEFM